MNNKEEMYKSVSRRKIEDLTAIYEDYLYMVRQHEQLLLLTSIEDLATEQKEEMYPEGYHFPWKIVELNTEEKQEFKDFIENNISGCGNSYICLQHVRDEENNGKPPVFSFSPYTMTTIGVHLPSQIERYKISYPQEATLGGTEFFIDGRYKSVYTGQKAKDELISDCINDQELLTEITLMLNLGEAFRHNGYIKNDDFEKMATEIYASERLVTNENNILEILGSFAEKVKNICNEKYGDIEEKKGKKNRSIQNLVRAHKEGFMNLPSYFFDYVNIRNFVRHQWEALDELEAFMPKENKDDSQKRSGRVTSYRYFCDKPIFLRMKSYIKALHQMQQIIAEVNPDRLIRDVSESYDDFVNRVKAVYRQNPDKKIEVEANYPLMSDKFLMLEGDLPKISPHIRIVDDFLEFDNNSRRLLARMDNYKMRSWFLQSFHAVECAALGHCLRRGKILNEKGKNITVHDAWDYLCEIGIITSKECRKWQDYTELRRKISHFYFAEYLKSCLNDIQNVYARDFQAMVKKFQKVGPRVVKKNDGVYEYTNIDGRVVTLDHNQHKIVSVEDVPALSIINHEAQALSNSDARRSYREVYRNGIEFKIESGKLAGVKFPNGVYVNMDNRSINWGDNIRWYSNAEDFNALKTENSRIITDKTLRVTSFFEKGRSISFGKGDVLLVDYRHNILLDSAGRIKEFNFKNAENKTVKAKFLHKSGDKADLISFADGTSILISGKDVTISHHDDVLSFYNRKKFVRTYDETPGVPPQSVIKPGEER